MFSATADKGEVVFCLRTQEGKIQFFLIHLCMNYCEDIAITLILELSLFSCCKYFKHALLPNSKKMQVMRY